MIERLLQAVVLRLHATPRHSRWRWRIVKNGRKIQPTRLPMIDGGSYVEHIDAPDHIVQAAEAELCHVLAHLLREEKEEIDDVLGLPLKLPAQHRILRGNSHRTSVEMALAHHDASQCNQRRGGETEFFGAEQRSDDHIAAGLQLAISLNADTAPQIIEQQHLLRLR